MTDINNNLPMLGYKIMTVNESNNKHNNKKEFQLASSLVSVSCCDISYALKLNSLKAQFS